jgi:hypothetical protein
MFFYTLPDDIKELILCGSLLFSCVSCSPLLGHPMIISMNLVWIVQEDHKVVVNIPFNVC